MLAKNECRTLRYSTFCFLAGISPHDGQQQYAFEVQASGDGSGDRSNSSNSNCAFQQSMDFNGGNLEKLPLSQTPHPADCCEACVQRIACAVAVWNPTSGCWLKSTASLTAPKNKAGVTACWRPGASTPAPMPIPPSPPSPPPPFGPGNYPSDSINFWPAIAAVGASSSSSSTLSKSPRQTLVLGHMAGGAMITSDGFKIVMAAQVVVVVVVAEQQQQYQ